MTIMTTLVLAFLGMLLIGLAMSVGVLFGRRPIQGSCGGMSAQGEQGECAICGRTPGTCDT